MTVRNEASNLPRLLDSVLAQTLVPAEVVIVDGGSSDGTQRIIRNYADKLPLRLIEMPGANISRGRNAAIEAVRCDTVAVTDAGVWLDPRWLESLAEALGAGVDVAAGFFLPDARTTFERTMGATVLPALEDVQPDNFLPSSRSVAFRREAWAAVGGYPEWLDYSEDLVFDFALLEAGCHFVFVPQAIVHFRPRSSLKSFYLQYYRYARGDGKADLWRKRHAIRYAAYTVGPLLIMLGLKWRHSLKGKGLLALAVAAAALYCRKPYLRLLPALRRLSLREASYALALVPLIRLTGDIAKMVGYPVGFIWRLRRASR